MVLPSPEAVDFLSASLASMPEGQATLARMDGKVTVADRSGLAGVVAGEGGFRCLVVVQPRPEDIRKLLLMPDPVRLDVSLIGDAAGIALVAAELAALATVPGLERIHDRVRLFLADIDDEQDRIEDLDFDASAVPPLPSAMVVDLISDEDNATPYAGEVCEIVVNSGYCVRYRPSSDVLCHTDDENRPFRKVEASQVGAGDRILVMTPKLMDRMRSRFLRKGRSSDMLALYHMQVAEARARIPGGDLSEKTRWVLDRLVCFHGRATAARFGEEDYANVRRWLSVDLAGGRIPRAPRHYHRFQAFMEVLGIPKVAAEQIWIHGIRFVRASHISEGLAFNRRCVAFLIDPDTMSAVSGLSEDGVNSLWSSVLSEVATVTATRRHKAPPHPATTPARRAPCPERSVTTGETALTETTGVAAPSAATSAAAMPESERIELQEAVCDALLGMLKARACGDGDIGAVLYCMPPSRQLVSGFLLPKYNAGGDDATSDIRIAVHGMDFRMHSGTGRTVAVEASGAVYVRLLPSADDLYHPAMAFRWSLLPRTRFRKEVERDIRERIRESMAKSKPKNAKESGEEYKRRRAEATARVLAELGVRLKGDAADAVSMADGGEGGEVAAVKGQAGPGSGKGPVKATKSAGTAAAGGSGVTATAAKSQQAGAAAAAVESSENGSIAVVGEGHDIPDALAVSEPISQKWKRLPLTLPAFAFDPDDPSWPDAVNAYNAGLADAALAAVKEWIETEEGKAWAWRKTSILPSQYRDRAAWERFLAEVRKTPPDPAELSNGVGPALMVDVDADPFDPGHVTVRVALENRSQDPGRKDRNEGETGIFGVGLRVMLPDGVLARLPMDRVKPSYHLTNWLERYAIGVNGGVDHERLDGADLLVTTWMPRWVQPRIEPTAIEGVPTRFAVLEDSGARDGSTDGGGLDGLARLPAAMRGWVAGLTVDLERGIADPEDRRREQANFEEDVRRWKAEADVIELGVSVLLRSRAAWRKDPACREAIPFRAWTATNKAFRRAGLHKGIEGWRLFQLAFVLSLVPALASRMEEFHDAFRDAHEDTATLLYFPTGGGKSEAFFGIKVFGLFLDRMRGKERGITAMIRYPLRLLTLQQAQRLSRTLAAAEMVRRELGLGGRPFEIGFYVGSANTPNRTTEGKSKVVEELTDIPAIDDPDHRDEDALAGKFPMYRERSLAYNKIPSCPFCGAPTMLRLFPDEAHRLGIVCSNEARGADACDWNKAEGGQSPLPFLLVDTDIYRRGPAVLIGTVDKLAMIGQHRSTIQKIAGMFGLGRWYDPVHGLVEIPDGRERLSEGPPQGWSRLAPAYADGEDRFHDPVPLLLTQDEGHLLEESLGTFAGLFETTLASWYDALADMLGTRAARIPGSTKGRRPKVVVATATVSDPDRQVRAIYQKSCVRFPHQGPTLYESFYARPKRFPDPVVDAARRGLMRWSADEEFVSPWMRVYASLMTNGRPHTITTVTALSMHHLHVTQALSDLADPATVPAVAAALRAHLSDGPLKARHEAALDRIAAAGDWAALRAVVDLFRITLTYVTNRKGGDQIMSALVGVADDLHRQQGRTLGDLRVELISGGVDAQKIQDVIRMTEEKAPPGTLLERLLRGVVATSAISHGVDVDKFNAMFFTGLPSDIAEYIQASSRVGRQHVGFSLLVPTPQARRDRYVVEIHETFHRFLERMIAPPAVERWADRAIGRAIPSLFQNWLVGVVAQREFLKAPDTDKPNANLMSNVKEIARIVRDRGEVRFLDGGGGARLRGDRHRRPGVARLRPGPL